MGNCCGKVDGYNRDPSVLLEAVKLVPESEVAPDVPVTLKWMESGGALGSCSGDSAKLWLPPKTEDDYIYKAVGKVFEWTEKVTIVDRADKPLARLVEKHLSCNHTYHVYTAAPGTQATKPSELLTRRYTIRDTFCDGGLCAETVYFVWEYPEPYPTPEDPTNLKNSEANYTIVSSGCNCGAKYVMLQGSCANGAYKQAPLVAKWEEAGKVNCKSEYRITVGPKIEFLFAMCMVSGVQRILNDIAEESNSG